MQRAFQLLGIVIGLFAVVIQFFIAVAMFTRNGMSLPGAIIGFLSFFTILTNLFAIAVYLAGLSASRLDFFRRPRVRASAVVSMTVVAIVYHFLLAGLWHPQGLQYVTDMLLHYVAPAIMLVWWLAYGRSGALRWRDIPAILVYPLIYLAYVLVRAPVAAAVPYPFLDYWTNGWSVVMQAIAGILALYIVLAALAVAADRFIPTRSTKAPAP